MAGTRNYDFLVGSPLKCHHVNVIYLTDPLPPSTPDQAPPDRRLRRRKVVLSPPLQRRFLHPFIHHNDRHRLQDPDHRAGREEGQAADMGYSRPGALSDHHDSIL